MISNTVRGLINLALSNLELGNPTQEAINKATNYLKEAVLQIKKEKEETEEEPQEYKVAPLIIEVLLLPIYGKT